MRLKENSSKQKLMGEYYTPKPISDYLVGLFRNQQFERVLEPSFGEGVFLESLRDAELISKIHHLDAVEIKSHQASVVGSEFDEYENISIINDDFLNFYERNKGRKYDLIVGNPPFIRYQYLTDEQRHIQSEILKENGMRPNRLINCWVCFLVACTRLLSDRGSIAMVIPAEIMQVAYANDLRKYLLSNLSLITIISFKRLVFPEIEQEVVLFIATKNGSIQGVRAIEVDDVEDLLTLDIEIFKPHPSFNTNEKWSWFYIDADESEIYRTISENRNFCKMGDVTNINVGITTGNNEYFSVSRDVELRYDLTCYLRPLIGRSSQTYGIIFTPEDWNLNVSLGKKAQLLCFPDVDQSCFNEKQRDYLTYGGTLEKNSGYKCSIRNHWYCVPSVYVPDAFLLRRNNEYPKFVLNGCDAVSTDTMHRVLIQDGVDPKKLLIAFYNSLTFASAELCGRSYGGGVLEILPGEAMNIAIPNPHLIPDKIVKDLLPKVDNAIREKRPIDEILDITDDEILHKLFCISKQDCQVIRSIWKKLQDRRLSRGRR